MFTGMKYFRCLAVCGLSLGLIACVSSRYSSGSARPGSTFWASLPLPDGVTRHSVWVHLPAGYQPGQSIPLVVMLHGGHSDAVEMEERSEWSAIADRENFIVAYPNGTGLFGYLRHWNAGHCCARGAARNWDDLEFLDAAIDALAGLFAVDTNQVFMAGHSNGGMMAYRFAAERPGKLAAIAVVSGAIGSRHPDLPAWKMPVPANGLPVIIIHGRQDDIVPFDGGIPPERPSANDYDSVSNAVTFWTGVNNCSPHFKQIMSHSDSVRTESWTGTSDVVLITIEGWDHRWPGGPITRNLDISDPLKSFDATERIWQFFDQTRQIHQ